MNLSDSMKLLRDYAERGDESAFSEVVGRYIDLVYSAALRRVGGDAHLARDVAQTVFADLARKARSLGNVQLLGGWLHRHTCFTSAALIRSERRRQAREQQAAEMNALQNSPDSLWQQLAPMLDESIDTLESADRQAIVLRFFERRDFRAIGTALGVSDDAAQKRVSRALEKLREMLAKRGVTLGATVLGSLMAGKLVSAAPVGFAAEVSRTALTGAVAGTAFSLSLAKLLSSLTAKLVLGTIAVSAVAWWLVSQRNLAHTGEPARQGKTVAAVVNPPDDPSTGGEPASAATVPARSDVARDSSNTLALTILAADVSKPVPDVKLDYWIWRNKEVTHKESLQASRFGVCNVPVPPDTTELILVSQCDGFADTRLDWRPDRGEAIPSKYTLRLARAVQIGGIVLDPDGQPVANAKVGFNNRPDPTEETRPQSDDFGWPFWITAKTDAQGHWSIDRIGKEAIRTIYGGASHSNFVESPMLFVSRDANAEKQLLDRNYIFKLGRAVAVRGVVLDSDGNPVAGANVLVGHVGESGRRETKSDSDGTFSVAGCKPGKNAITATADGFAATTLDVNLGTDSGPYQIKLQRGRVLKLRVVNERGEPIAGAGVWLNTLTQPLPNGAGQQPTFAQVDFNRKTDVNGILEWDSAPDEDLNFEISATGYMRSRNVKVHPDGEEHVVTLTPAFTISGTVRDATTGKPIPHFRIVTGWPTVNPIGNTTNFQWSTIDRFWLNFDGGKFKHVYEEPVISGTPDPSFVFKFEADGYAPFVTRVVRAAEDQAQFDVVLQPAVATTITVLTPDGNRAEGVDVGLVSPGVQLRLIPGGFSRDNVQSGGSLLLTDQQGEFKLPPDDAITNVIAAGAQGYAEAAPTELSENPIIRLHPWGRLEGTWLSGGQPASDREIFFEFGNGGNESIGSDIVAYETKTDDNGRFVFAQVPPGLHKLARWNPEGANTRSEEIMMDVRIQSGKTTTVTLGASNYCVTARLRWPADLKRDASTRVFAVIHTPIPKPPENALADPQAVAVWRAMPEVKAALAHMEQFRLDENSRGVFSADAVPPGNYDLTVSVIQVPAAGDQPKPLVHADVPVTVPSDPPTGKLDLGEIILQPAGKN